LRPHFLEKLLADSIQGAYGFEVPVLVKSVGQVKKILEYNPFENEQDSVVNKIYFVLLSNTPADEVFIK